MAADILEFAPWEVHTFPWGVAVRHQKGPWETIFLHDGQEWNVEHMKVHLSDEGIEFL